MRKFKIKVNSREYIVEVEELKETKENKENKEAKEAKETKETATEQKIEKQMPSTRPASNTLKSPMAGNIVKISCKIGDAVKQGQLLLLLEAMKMENEITAPKDGIIKNVLVSEGMVVKSKQPLLELED